MNYTHTQSDVVLYVRSMGKLLKVIAIRETDAEANAYMASHDEAADPALVRGMVLEWIGAVDHEATLVAWVVALVARCEALKLVTTREYTLTTSNDTDLCVHDIRERISTTYKLSGGDTITLTYSGVSK